MVIGSLATLDLPMVVDLIGIYVLKGLYCTLTMTDWFLQALSVIPRGSWGDVARRFTMIRWISTLLATRAWLRPVSRGNRHFTVDCGRIRQSGPRPDTRLLRQPALEGLTRSARTDSPPQVGRNKFRRHVAATAAAHKGGDGGFWKGEGRRLLLRDTASHGPTTIVVPESQFRTCPSDHGITDSTCKNHLVVVSVQYGPFNPYISRSDQRPLVNRESL
ncbi:hypothetical protein F511_19928 [Dorcoceras hygrometricum]|uniref:Uncharacterized protein n=1 Tax=Dorcoceras hygrometricum TaxID=472368 RepID=A0A2Z7DG20_9LAMI|nr:hypothetical protein F511_19928 [Dorcoceras hygrometricum]